MSRSNWEAAVASLAVGRTELSGDVRRSIYRRFGLKEWTLHYTYEGKGRISYQGADLSSPVGDLLIHTPQSEDDYGIDEDHPEWTHLWATFAMPDNWYHVLSWPQMFPGIYRVHLHERRMRSRVEDLFLDLLHLFRSPMPHRKEIAMTQLQAILLCGSAVAGVGSKNGLDTRVQEGLNFIHENIALPLTVEQIARFAGLSPSRFAHVFREQIGLSPIKYIERERIQRSCQELLMSTKSIQNIAYEFGFSDNAYFTKIFKRQMGMTPRSYRKQEI